MQQQEHALVLVDPQSLNDIANKGVVQGGSIMTAVFTLIAGLMWVRRKMSSDSLESKKDRTESQLLEIVIKERNAAMDDAREAWARRAADAELIGKLSAEVEGLRLLNSKTNNEVQLLRVLNDKQSAEIAQIRAEMSEMRTQLRTCVSCPLRRIGNENQAGS